MSDLRFEWDPRKSRANRREHRVGFEEAQDVFLDDDALLIGDPDHSDEEHRFVLMGMSRARVLVVCHCYRDDGDVIRIISARKADREERRLYAGRRRK